MDNPALGHSAVANLAFAHSATGSPAAGRLPSGRDRIFASASLLFERDGFHETGVREIAAAAGLAPGMVIRYFGSKEQLFLTTMSVDDGLTQVLLHGPLDTLGVDLVRFMLSTRVCDLSSHGIFSALMRASDRPAVRASLRHALEISVVEPLAPRLDGPDADLRARLVASCVIGLLGSLELVADQKMIDADQQTLVALYAPSIQHLVTGLITADH